ncbi:hypothetical protein ALE3EI_1623 [Constantimarinum furrinae]|uniref:Uncharacterized protein n=2 Tax=Constantimarinum furrinae TaxID=2562285 RepID=A0A7G8PV11_9FLAO|nr:hypothetical protein ALE3EI_1623 [Constantimarinum furrinae]
MKFRLEHNETIIYANYEFGHQHLAKFNFDLNPTREIPEFIISTKYHFSRLFGLNKEIWKIKSQDQFTIASLKDYLNKSGMTDLSKKVAFIPTITGKYQNGIFNCETVFHLGFDDKEESFKPNMDFQKILVDKLKEKYCS